jgi:acetolactate synthase-1/2/3 large subunit
MNKKKVAKIIFEFLAEKGINKVFYLAGGGSMYLNNALNLSKKIEGIPCHHEQSCGIAAEAFGRVSKNNKNCFGVSLVTSGPGATNIITPVAGAWIESVPIFVISGQAKRKDSLKKKKIRQSGTQEIDIISIVKPITKYAVKINNPKLILYYLQKAYFEMMNKRKGPVWLDIPLDIQNMDVNLKKIKKFNEKKSIRKNYNISKIYKLLEKSKRPVFLIGHGVRLSSANKILLKIIKKFKVPFLATWPALDLINYSHNQYMGRPGVVAPRSANFVLQNSDLLISIGARLENNITAYNPKNLARNAKKVIVDIDHEELKLKKTIGDILVCDDAMNFLNSLSKYTLKNKKHEAWLNKCLEWKLKYDLKLTKKISSRKKFNNNFSHYEFINALSTLLPSNRLIVTGSSGLAIEFFYAHFKNKINQRVIHTSGLGAMGYGLPALIGASLNNSNKSYLIESDGSFQLNIQELATIKAQKLSTCIIIMNNGGYASIRNSQQNHFNGLVKGCDNKSGLFFPSIEGLSKAYSINYLKVRNYHELNAAIKSYEKRSSTVIIEAVLNLFENLEPKSSVIKINDKIYSMPLEDMTPLLSLNDLKKEMLIPLTKISKSNQLRKN